MQEAKAAVLPIHFAGQNGRLFHLASKVSLTARTSLLIREFARLSGKTIEAQIGDVLQWSELAHYQDRKMLVDRLYRAVFDLAPSRPP